ncbi:MAG TPA: thermonuclease family protein [bacterium]|nr:thermonuclease family protein [bacterium]
MARLLALAVLLALSCAGGGARADAPPFPPAAGGPGQPAARIYRLAHPLLRVIDGDTLDIDLNGDGRLEVPAERLRLLYVDAPELHPSPKGQDLAHGLPARAFLRAAVTDQPLVVTVLAGNARDRYGRTLALLQAGPLAVNLALIRAGHSYFDNRFGFPAAYERYAEAEAEAFAARRGIWADAPSRGRYLQRLRREGKTPKAPGNPWYWPGITALPRAAASGAVGRYVEVQGVLTSLHPLSRGVWVATLGSLAGRGQLRAVLFPKTAQWLRVRTWSLGSPVHLEGFMRSYLGHPELQVHHGRLL